MPLTIDRPSKPLETLAANLPAKAEELTHEQAIMAQGVLMAYTPNRYKATGRLQPAVGKLDPIASGYGVGGPVGEGGLLPNVKPAPRGTIAEFLMMHPEFAPRNAGWDEAAPSYHPKGKPFPMAWWHLSQEARNTLREERAEGAYQSEAPAAPYWIIANEGMPRVGIWARRYLENSASAIQRGEPLVKTRVMGNL